MHQHGVVVGVVAGEGGGRGGGRAGTRGQGVHVGVGRGEKSSGEGCCKCVEPCSCP